MNWRRAGDGGGGGGGGRRGNDFFFSFSLSFFILLPGRLVVVREGAAYVGRRGGAGVEKNVSM